jgi:hypothetical protein
MKLFLCFRRAPFAGRLRARLSAARCGRVAMEATDAFIAPLARMPVRLFQRSELLRRVAYEAIGARLCRKMLGRICGNRARLSLGRKVIKAAYYYHHYGYEYQIAGTHAHAVSPNHSKKRMFIVLVQQSKQAM